MFISIDPENDTEQVREQVIDSRSKRFMSGKLAPQALEALSNQLIEKIHSQSPTHNHVGKLYLISPTGKISRIYTSTQLSTERMIADLTQTIVAGNEYEPFPSQHLAIKK